MRSSRSLSTLLLASLAALPLTSVSAQGPAAARTPQLVVLITVDQLRADAYERYREHLRFGFPRIYEGGAVFTEAYQDHAFTETAPGHAALLSGQFPVHSGIATNATGVNGSAAAPLLTGGPSDPGASPDRFRATTLIDWLTTAGRPPRILSVSRKDRGAILPVGRARGPVYWYTSTGQFTTSTYYADTLPTWLRRFNDRHLPWQYAGQSWTPLYGSSVYAEPDSVIAENGGRDLWFPHRMPRDVAAADTAITQYPWMDQITLQLVLEGVVRLGLGDSPTRTDIVSVSLSATDAVGHRYGPDSKEYHDQVLQLDLYLGAFLDSLYALRDSSRIVIALTADHGVSPFAWLASGVEPNAGATRVDVAPAWQSLRQRLDSAKLSPPDSFAVFADNILSLPTARLVARGFAPDSIARSFASDVRRINDVERADLLASLASLDTTRDVIARRWLHTLQPQADTTRLVVTLTRGSYPAGVTIAMHGSPHDPDAHVPLVLRGAGIVPGRVHRFVRVVDLAPTLAALLGVKTPPLDGRVLTEVIR